MNNHITLVGYVGQPPKQKIFEEGNRVCKFSVGVKEYTSKDEANRTLLSFDARGMGLVIGALEVVTVG